MAKKQYNWAKNIGYSTIAIATEAMPPLYITLLTVSAQFPFGLGSAFAGLPGPFLPPRPAAPPTLQFQIPPGTCGLACSVFDTLAGSFYPTASNGGSRRFHNHGEGPY